MLPRGIIDKGHDGHGQELKVGRMQTVTVRIINQLVYCNDLSSVATAFRASLHSGKKRGTTNIPADIAGRKRGVSAIYPRYTRSKLSLHI